MEEKRVSCSRSKKPRHGNIYRVDCPFVMNDEDERIEQSAHHEMNMMIMGNRFEAARINDSVSENVFPFQCTGTSSDLEGNVSGDNEYVFGFGQSIETLPEWLRSEPASTFWLFFPNSSLLRGVNSRVREVGRRVGTAMYKMHINDQYLGNFLEVAFLKQGSDLPAMCPRFEQDLIDGIRGDIRGFRDFILSFERHAPIQPKMQHNQRYRAILDLAIDLCSEVEKCTTIEQLKILSYFVCHVPIFWERDQRRDFMDAFYRIIRGQYLTGYVNGSPILSAGEYKIEPAKPVTQLFNENIAFWKVARGVNNKLSSGVEIPLYHRACFIHFEDHDSSKSFESVHDKLQEYFPGAIPKTWFEIWSFILMTRRNCTEILAELQGQPGNFDYSKN